MSVPVSRMCVYSDIAEVAWSHHNPFLQNHRIESISSGIVLDPRVKMCRELVANVHRTLRRV